MLLQFALATALSAANPALGLLETAKDQLARHDDVAARKTIERALPYAADDRLLLGRLYQLLGLAWAEGAYEQRAIEAFGTALKLDRQLTLPADTAPKIQEWWKRAGGTHVESEGQPEPTPPSEPAPEPEPQPEVKPSPEPPPVAESAKSPVQTVKRWWALFPAGVSAVCLAVTGVTWKLSNDRHGELARGQRPLLPDEYQGLYQSGQSLQAAAQLTGAVAALFALVAISVALLITDT